MKFTFFIFNSFKDLIKYIFNLYKTCRNLLFLQLFIVSVIIIFIINRNLKNKITNFIGLNFERGKSIVTLHYKSLVVSIFIECFESLKKYPIKCKQLMFYL